jgi:hypothetical protein
MDVRHGQAPLPGQSFQMGLVGDSRPRQAVPGNRPGRRLPLLLASLLAAIAFSWPLPSRLDTVLRDPYDAQTQAWVVAWVRHALTSDLSSLYQANAFAPARDVLAFSEPLLGYGLLAIPLGAAGLSPAGVLNALCILVLGLSVFSIACLASELGASPGAAFVGAAAAGFGAITTVQFGFVSFTAFGGIAWMVLFARRLLRGGSLRDAGNLALATAITGYFSLHLLAFGLATVLVLGVTHLVAAPRPTLRHAGPRMAAACALAGLLLLPVVVPLLRVRKNEGFKRDRDEMAKFSASPIHFASTTPYNPGQAFLPGRNYSEMALYPGTAALFLAFAGLVLVRRAPALPALAGTGVLVAATGALGAMGLNAPLWPALAFLAPPLFGGIRVTARFGFVLQIGMGLLAAWGAGKLLALARDGAARFLATGALLVLVAIDSRQSLPFSFHPESEPSPADSFLARSFTGGPILHLPLTHSPVEARVLYASTHGFPRIVNGTLSYVPARHQALAARFATGPLDPALLARLESWPVGVIVLHDHWMPPANRARVLLFLDEARAAGQLSGPLRFGHGRGHDWVFGVVRNGAVAPPSEIAAHDLGAEADEWAAIVEGTRDTDLSRNDDSLVGSVDGPPEGGTVQGKLVVRGWARAEGEDLKVSFLFDGEFRLPASFRRVSRPDVAMAFPRLGTCETAGYEAEFPFGPGDDGKRDVRAVFRTRDGRFRLYPPRSFTWEP